MCRQCSDLLTRPGHNWREMETVGLWCPWQKGQGAAVSGLLHFAPCIACSGADSVRTSVSVVPPQSLGLAVLATIPMRIFQVGPSSGSEIPLMLD